MDEVNLYIYSGVKALRPLKNQGAAVGFILETQHGRDSITYTETIEVDGITKSYSHLYVLQQALSHIKKPVALSIYTNERGLEKTFTEWINTWNSNGWRNSRGEPVKYQEEYKNISEALASHAVSWNFERHEYSEWLVTEVEKSRICLKGIWSREEGETQ